MNLFHLSPFRKLNSKEIEPVINRILAICPESHVIRFRLIPFTIVIKQGFTYTEFVPVLIVRSHNELNAVKKQSKQTTHIRKHIIDFAILSLDAEFPGRFIHFQVHKLVSCGHWSCLTPINVVPLSRFVWIPWHDVGICTYFIIGYLNVSKRSCSCTECNQHVFFDNIGHCVFFSWRNDWVFHQ